TLQKILLTDEQIRQWGWRIPFVVGALLSVVAFYIRSRLDETKSFEKIRERTEKGKISALLQHPRAILTVVGLTLGGTIAFYTYSIYMQKLLVNTVHLSIGQSTNISFLS